MRNLKEHHEDSKVFTVFWWVFMLLRRGNQYSVVRILQRLLICYATSPSHLDRNACSERCKRRKSRQPNSGRVCRKGVSEVPKNRPRSWGKKTSELERKEQWDLLGWLPVVSCLTAKKLRNWYIACFFFCSTVGFAKALSGRGFASCFCLFLCW